MDHHDLIYTCTADALLKQKEDPATVDALYTYPYAYTYVRAHCNVHPMLIEHVVPVPKARRVSACSGLI